MLCWTGKIRVKPIDQDPLYDAQGVKAASWNECASFAKRLELSKINVMSNAGRDWSGM